MNLTCQDGKLIRHNHCLSYPGGPGCIFLTSVLILSLLYDLEKWDPCLLIPQT